MVRPPPPAAIARSAAPVGMVKRVGAQPVMRWSLVAATSGTVEPGVAEPRAAQHMVEVVVRQARSVQTPLLEQPDIHIRSPGHQFRSYPESTRNNSRRGRTTPTVTSRAAKPGSPDASAKSLPSDSLTQRQRCGRGYCLVSRAWAPHCKG